MDKQYLEDLIWMSYRYCIGRKTIAAEMHASNIAKYSYNDIPDNRKEFMAHDIRRSINDCLWSNFMSVSDYRQHIKEDGLSLILWRLREKYGDELPCGFDERMMHFTVKDGIVSFVENPDFDVLKDQYDRLASKYSDLIPWIKLANALDKQQHKTIVTEYEEKVEEKICFHFPILDFRMTEIREAWVELDYYLKNPHVCSYISPEYIKEIK